MLKNYSVLSKYSDFKRIEEQILKEVKGNKSLVDLVLECENYFEMKQLQIHLIEIYRNKVRVK